MLKALHPSLAGSSQVPAPLPSYILLYMPGIERILEASESSTLQELSQHLPYQLRYI